MKNKIALYALCIVCFMQANSSSSEELLNAPILNISPEDAGHLLEALPAGEILFDDLTEEEANLPMRALPVAEEDNTPALPIKTLPVDRMPVPSISVMTGNGIKSISVPVGGPRVRSGENTVKFVDGDVQVNAAVPAAAKK